MAAEPQPDHESIRASFAEYSACDISDALLKLQHPRGGFLPGISLWSPGRQEGITKLVGPAYTVKFVSNLQINAPKLEQHYIDTTPSGAVVLISAPKGTAHAVYGGLMSHRARYLGALGTVIDGNLRDLDEHRTLNYTVFARDVATPPFYEVARASEVNVPIKINDDRLEVIVAPGDYIVGDLNGAVAVPKSHIKQVLELLPQLVEAERKVTEDIDNGASFAEATKRHRRK